MHISILKRPKKTSWMIKIVCSTYFKVISVTAIKPYLSILTYSNVMQFQVSKLLLFSNFVDGWSRPSPNYTSKTILQFACRSKSLGLSHFKRHFKSGPEIFKWQKKQFIKSFLFKKIQLYKLNGSSSSSSHQFLKQRFCQVDLHPLPCPAVT